LTNRNKRNKFTCDGTPVKFRKSYIILHKGAPPSCRSPYWDHMTRWIWTLLLLDFWLWNKLFKGDKYSCKEHFYFTGCIDIKSKIVTVTLRFSINTSASYSLIDYRGLSHHRELVWVKRCRQANEMWLYLSLLLLPSLANKYFSNRAIILRSVGERMPAMLTRVPTSTLLLKISLSSSGKLTSVVHIPTQPPYPMEVCFVFSSLAHSLPVQSHHAVMWQ